MEKQGKKKKYPIFTYLCFLVILGILLTGVTLARYTGAVSGNVGTSLSRFVCSYTISDASSLTFANTDYWLELEDGDKSATNTARSVRFDLRNYVGESGSVERVSGVALQSTLRFYAPAEFAEGLAFQLAAVNEGGSYTAISPQYVLRDLVYTIRNADAAGEEYEVGTAEERAFAAGERIIETARSKNYGDRTDGLTAEQVSALEQRLSVTGGFTGSREAHTGSITAKAENGAAEISVTAQMQTARYSVGYMRTEAAQGGVVGGGSASNKMAPLLYIDCEKEVPFYTVDLRVPSMYFEAAQAESKTFMLFITVTERNTNGDFSDEWTEETHGALLTEPQRGAAPYELNGATVSGYHFTRDLPVYTLSGGALREEGETQVRITKTYNYEQGGAALSFEHVAPVSSAPGSASVEHAVESFYAFAGGAFTAAQADLSSAAGVRGLYGVCSNEAAAGDYIFFGDLSDDPYFDVAAEEGGAKKYTLSEALSKGFSTRLNVLFAQASESGTGGAA